MPWNILAKFILRLIKKFWPFAIVGVIILGAWTYINILQNKVKNLSEDNKRLESELFVCRDKIDEQNSAIEEFHTQSLKQKQEMSKLKNKILDLNKLEKQSVQNILQEKIPKRCDNAIKYLIDGAKDLKW